MGVAFVGGFEFFDKAGEEAGAVGVAGSFVVLHEVAAAAAEDFADRRGGEVGDLGRNLAGTEPVEELVGAAEGAVFEGVDEEGAVFGVAADHEMSGQADGFEFETEAVSDEQVNVAKGNRDAFAAGEDLVEEAVEWIGVVLGVAVETVFVKEHPVDDATFFADGHGLGEKFAAAGGEGIELFAAGADVDARENGAIEQKGAGFEFVVE